MPVRAVGPPVDAVAAVVLTRLNPSRRGVFRASLRDSRKLIDCSCARSRATAQGFTYNFGRRIGALFPALVGFMGATMPLGAAIGLFAGIAHVAVIIAVALLPETRGKALQVYD
jgi:hypothetical protein